jgi:hypothetical protein
MNEHSDVQLLKREEQPPALTLYLDFPLHIKKTTPMTGIFIPEHYVPGPKVDIILYLHGHRSTEVCGPDPLTIDRYWLSSSSKSYFPLREETNMSEKNVILVAPTLGPLAEPGDLTDKRRFEAYLDDVLAALRKYGPYQKAGLYQTYGNIILACHSAGGVPMLKLALLGKHIYADRIRECWGFDCLYHEDEPQKWAQWAGDHANAKLFIHYLGTAKYSNKLKEMHCQNVVVEKSVVRKEQPHEEPHCWVPKKHWKQRIQATAFLQAKSTTNESPGL